MKRTLKNQNREGRTFINASMLHPVRGKSGVRRSPGRVVGNPSEHFLDITAPNWVVAWQLPEIAVNADVLNRHLAVGPTDMVVITDGRLEEWALAYTSLGVCATFDRSLEKRVLGSVPTVLEVSMAGVPYIVTSSQDEGAVVVFKVLGMGKLLDEDRHKPDRMGGRAGASFMRTDRVRYMVLEVGARCVLTIPARREDDLNTNAVGTIARWERVRLWDGRLVVAEAMVVEGLVRGIRCHLASGGRARDHAEILGELLDVGFGATMQVVHGPI